MGKFYTGVGSRETPDKVMDLMTRLARFLDSKGYILRSGGADGADKAFENGAGIDKIIYKVKDSTPECEAIAERIHPAWNKCSDYARKLHGRNIKQVLGDDLKTPSDFLLCWTKEGKDVGGTRTAIVLAREKGIPVFNLFYQESLYVFLSMYFDNEKELFLFDYRELTWMDSI